jgi:hypothetical protein
MFIGLRAGFVRLRDDRRPRQAMAITEWSESNAAFEPSVVAQPWAAPFIAAGGDGESCYPSDFRPGGEGVRLWR